MPQTSFRKQQIGFRCDGSESEETSWDNEPRKEERFARIRARVPTGHPHLAKKLLQMQQLLVSEDEIAQSSENEPDSEEDRRAKAKLKKSPKREKKSSSKKKRHDSSSGEEHEPVVKGSKKKKESKHEEVHIGRATVVDHDGDSSWEEANRKQERFARIRKRVPTGHPGLAKKVEMLRAAQLAESDDDQVEVIVRQDASSDDETEASPPKSKSKKSSSKLKTSSKKDSAKKTRRSKESIQFGEAKAVDDSDNSWDDRHRKEERFTRIRSRVPTGHPGLAKKVAQLRQQMMDDTSDTSDTEIEARKKKSSKSRSVRI